jgi:hypothetical protein
MDATLAFEGGSRVMEGEGLCGVWELLDRARIMDHLDGSWTVVSGALLRHVTCVKSSGRKESGARDPTDCYYEGFIHICMLNSRLLSPI